MTVLRVLAPLLMALVAALAISRRRLVHRFTVAGSDSARRAIDVPVANPLMAFWLRRLRQAGVLQTTSGGRVWLDEPAWQAYRQARRTRAMTVLVVVLVVLLLLFATGTLGAASLTGVTA